MSLNSKFSLWSEVNWKGRRETRMAENETNGTDLLSALSKQLESQQETIERLNQQMMDQIALIESNNQTNQVNLNSVSF